MFDVPLSLLSDGVTLSDLCAVHTRVAESRGEFRRLVQGGGVSLNKEKIENAEAAVTGEMLLNGKYLLLQKGKKSYFLIRVLKD